MNPNLSLATLTQRAAMRPTPSRQVVKSLASSLNPCGASKACSIATRSCAAREQMPAPLQRCPKSRATRSLSPSSRSQAPSIPARASKSRVISTSACARRFSPSVLLAGRGPTASVWKRRWRARGALRLRVFLVFPPLLPLGSGPRKEGKEEKPYPCLRTWSRPRAVFFPTVFLVDHRRGKSPEPSQRN